MNELNHNTILAASDAAFGAPRFDLFREEDYLPAFRAAIATAKAEVDAIVDDPREADFRNTVLALEYAGSRGCATAGITCNPDTPITKACDMPIVVRTGPEVVTGSTRMKAGTAQKLILNESYVLR